jgi:hypothetical protein
MDLRGVKYSPIQISKQELVWEVQGRKIIAAESMLFIGMLVI